MALLLVSLVLITFINSTTGEFVSDDIEVIANNTHLGDLSYVFAQPLAAPRLIPLYISYAMGGYQPFFYHIFNIVFHLGTVLMFFLVLLEFIDDWIAFFIAALFAVHPTTSESVAWISALPYPQGAFFMMLSFYLYLKSKKKAEKKIRILFYSLSILVFFVAIQSLQKSLVLAAVIFAYELAFGSLKKTWKRIIPYFIFAGMYAYTYISSIWSLNDNVNTVAKFNDTFSRFHNPLLQWPVSIETYIRLTLLPIWLSFYHVEDTFISPFAWARAWVVFLIFLGLLVYTFRKNKFVFFWLSFFAIVVSPNEIPYSLAYVVAERYMYGASVGIIAAVVYVIYKRCHTAKAKKYLYIGLSIVLALFMVRTIARNTIWQDADHLWLATVQDAPTSYAAHNNAGNVYAHSSRCVDGLREYKLKMKYIPKDFGPSEYGNGYYNMGVCATQLGNIDEAIQYYQKSAKLIPRMWLPFENLGMIYYKQKNYKGAREQFEKAVARGTQNPNISIYLEQLKLKGY